MRQAFREFRRAPARIATSVLALALALGAMGVFAIPSVASSSLRDSVDRDRMANIVLPTTDASGVDIAELAESIDGVDDARAEIRVSVGVGRPDPGDVVIDVIGRDLLDTSVDALNVSAGRLPVAAGQVLVTDGVASVGDVVSVTAPDGQLHELAVVGVGATSWWAGESVAFSTLETASDIGGEAANRLAVRAADDSAGALRSTAADLRDRLAGLGISTTSLPITVADGTHPIEDDIEQVSTLIGFLGIVAGLVALVLLGSTTNTLIVERTREAAVMRALGARGRPLRRRLRRLAVAIAAAAVVVGLPLGIVVSNVIARMVMQEFLDITPGIAVSVPVLAISAVFALGGAALVASGAARRVTRIPLATALRDRDGSPFGRRWSERLVARFRVGGLLDRNAIRAVVHRRSRAIAVVAQVTAAVAALLIIASMATTITAFNESEYEPWTWNSRTTLVGSGLDIDAATISRVVAEAPTAERGIETIGEVDGWEVDVFGLEPDTSMFDRGVDAGTWLPASSADGVVVTTGFAERTGIAVGDDIEVELATGTESYRVVGLHPLKNRAVFVGVDPLAADLGNPGAANAIYSDSGTPPVGLTGLSSTALIDDLSSDDSGRTAILLIFGAIGLVVVTVAGLAVASGLMVNVYERRREFATMRAIGGRSRQVMRVVVVEVLPLAVLGVLAGTMFGYLGAQAITESFESADAVDIGFVFAGGAILPAALTVLFGCAAICAVTMQRIGRRSVADTLRSTT